MRGPLLGSRFQTCLTPLDPRNQPRAKTVRRRSWRRLSIALLGLCLYLFASQVPGAAPPPPRNRQEVEAVLAQAHPEPPTGELRPLQVVLVANRKDPVAPDPKDPNLLLWLDASDQATVTTASEGCVSAWSNKAAHVGRKLTSSAAQQPLYVAQALGGRPALRFDGIDDVLRDAGFAQSAQTWTVMLVVTPRSNTGDGQFHALVATNRPGQDDFVTGLNLDLGPRGTAEFSVLNLEGIKDAPGATNLRTETAPFAEGQIIVLTTGTGRSRLWINGTEEDGRAANEALTAMDEIRVGGRFYGNQERGFFHGDVSEVLIYKTELSDPERDGLVAHLLQKYGPDIRQSVGYTLQDAWEYLPQYDWGSSRRRLEPIDEAIRCFPVDQQTRTSLESRLVEVLADPAATLAAKDYACRRLAIVGSAASVPALAGLLADEKLSNLACFALERIPDSAAEEALVQALKSVRGSLRIGVIHALGSRRSQTAVADLVRLLADEDPVTRRTAAAALGTSGGPAAAEALATALADAPAADRAALAESCLKCAEQCRAAGQPAEALALYERLRGRSFPQRRGWRRRGGSSWHTEPPGCPCSWNNSPATTRAAKRWPCCWSASCRAPT